MTGDTGWQVLVLLALATLTLPSHTIKRKGGKERPFAVPEDDRPTVGRVYLGAHVLQLQALPGADVVALLWVADQPAVVHPGLDLAVLVLPLPLLLLRLLDLPAQLHHERFHHHLCGIPLGNAAGGLIPPEPGCQ